MRALATLAAAAMVLGLFLPWLGDAVPGARFAPWDLLRHLDPDVDTVKRLLNDSPPALLAFLATFALAALFVLLSLAGFASRLLAIVTGGLAVGLSVFAVLRLRDKLAEFGVPLPRDLSLGDLTQDQLTQIAGHVIGYGLWAWAGGAVLLLLAGLTGFPRR